MANHKSALKRARQSETRHARNRINKTKVKNALKQARAAVGGPAEASAEALKKAMTVLCKAASKGAFHRKNVARRISRLSRQMHKAASAPAAA